MSSLKNLSSEDFHDELAEISRCLEVVNRGYGSLKIICSEDDNSTSTIINSTKEQGLDNNFVLTEIKISNEFKVTSLQELYSNIMQNLIVQRQGVITPTSFEAIFQIWLERIRSYPDKNVAQGEIFSIISELEKHSVVFAKAFLSYIKSKINGDSESSSALASLLMGKNEDNCTVGDKGLDQKQHEPIKFLKAFAKLVQYIGFSGILIIVDDLQLVLNERSDLRAGCYDVLKSLLDAIKSDTLQGCMFLFGSTYDIVEDQLRGFYSDYGLCQRLGSMDHRNTDTYDVKNTVMFVK
ncbi:DUF2791 family P-loop domain-containing protein [Alkalicella caledoniensis]|uniref:DUF2791 family P-loop domain-containing protein n=1 Tax=Alkalicella caledoniensis TaxID=2731377 RepID=A0A7G9W5H8_ALKCA|nr:BREX system ATP-binding domain-containing protein [Alkalicella caledoniensis]QNO13940.1 DUF2791 family P-loop domain-containing protein [Alkalicella caledoniensis]